MGLHGAKHMGVLMYVPCDNSQGPGTWNTQQQGEQAHNNSNNSGSKVQLWRNLQKTNVSHTQRWPKRQARHLKRTCLCVCVCVCCVFSGLAMFFTFRLLWRNKLSATHTYTNAGTCINYTYATLVAAPTKASQVAWPTFVTHTLAHLSLLPY